MKITVLTDNKAKAPLKGEWGLSLYIENEEDKILLDTGASPLFAENAEKCADELLFEALKNGCDYAYIHIEAPDECGHRREPENKVRAIEIIDEQVLPILFEGLKDYDDYKIMILPDHPTPIVTATHASDPVPFMIYHKNNEVPGVDTINEETAKATGLFVESGVQLMKKFLED